MRRARPAGLSGMGTPPVTRGVLVGREGARRRLDVLAGALGSGRGGVLVVRGEAGIGETALLAHAREAASGWRVLEASGSEFERELPFEDSAASSPAPARLRR